MSFNTRVKRHVAKKYNGNVSEAARVTGVPRNTLWAIVRGLTRTPSADVLVKLSDDMGVTIDSLIRGEQ